MSRFMKLRILAVLFLTASSGRVLLASWADYFDFSKMDAAKLSEKTKELASKIDGKQATMAIALAAAMAYGYKVYRDNEWMNKIANKIDEADASLRPGSEPGREGVWAKWRKQARVWASSDIYKSPYDIRDKFSSELVGQVLDDLRRGKLVFAGIDPLFSDELNVVNQLLRLVVAEKKELYDYIIDLGMQIEVGEEESGVLNEGVSGDVATTGRRASQTVRGSARSYENKYFNSDFWLDKLSDAVSKWGMGPQESKPTSNYYSKYFGSFFGRDKIALQQKFEDKLYALFNARDQRGINGFDNLDILTADDIALRKNFIDKVCGTGVLVSKRAAGLFFDTAVAYGRLVAIQNKLIDYRLQMSAGAAKAAQASVGAAPVRRAPVKTVQVVAGQVPVKTAQIPAVDAKQAVDDVEL